MLPPATKHVVLAALRRGRLPQLQELHPGAGEHHACSLRPRWLLQQLGHEQHGGASLRPTVQLAQSRTSATRTGIDGGCAGNTAIPDWQVRNIPSCRTQDPLDFFRDHGKPGLHVKQQIGVEEHAEFRDFLDCRQRILEVQVGERSDGLGGVQEVHS